ncbi:MAG TPA: hypothetical protein VFW83_07100 [Bryobacteraceae bacterium]|nr:hypothetical protein [Bryobacteraceae bacterium]
MRKREKVLGAAVLLVFVAGAAAWAAEAHDDAFDYPYLDMDHPAIHYSSAAPDDPIARLQKKLDSGETTLAYDGRFGYLPSLLKHLDLNIDSQLLVFSKTSFQAPKISQKAPRALYFNDNVAVGYVREGDMMELASLDPKQGVVFYTLDFEKTEKPSFLRRKQQCLACHLIPGTLNVPGLLVTSVIPAPDGSPRFAASALMVDERTSLNKRWGGWFVTGTSGGLMHRGNSVAPSANAPDVLDLRGNQNITNLASRTDTKAELAPTSDIVALMVIDHQARMVNLMTRLGWETRVAMQEGKLDQSRERLDFVADQVVQYMLFVKEARIYDPIVGTSTFTKTFEARGPRDKKGRSLRDFDLHKRLFKYPLSYMIYSPSFDGMPEPAKQRVYQRLFDVLTGKDQSPEFSNLSPEDRRAIFEIVRDTKPGLPAYWKNDLAE